MKKFQMQLTSESVAFIAVVLFACSGGVTGNGNPGGSAGSESQGGSSGGGANTTGGTRASTGGTRASGGTNGSGGESTAGTAGSGGAGGAGTGGTATGGAAGGAGTGGTLSTPVGTPTFVAVGYGGVRVRSTDLGKTWTDSQRLGGGGDDQYLLRAVAYGNGVFVAAGWQIHTSPDGKTWTARTNPNKQWLGGVKYGNGKFGAAGGYGYSAYSIDGLVWMAGQGRGTDAARGVSFGNGMWTANADSGSWWQSTNGQTWLNIGGGHNGQVVWCATQFRNASDCNLPIAKNDGSTAFGKATYVTVSDRNIERSTDDGKTWTKVFTASDGLEDVAFGYAP